MSKSHETKRYSSTKLNKHLFVLFGFVALGLALYVAGNHSFAGARAMNDEPLAEKPTKTTATVGEQAPDFALVDHKGRQHKLSDYRGKVVVLEWVNFDCPFVVKHYSSGNMQRLQATYAKKNVVWLSICSSATGKQGHFDAGGIEARLKERKAQVTAYLIDETGKVGRLYEAKTTPQMFVVDEKGVLRYDGAIDSIRSANTADIPKATNYLSSSLDALLAGKPINTPTKTVPYGCSVKY